MNFNKQDKMKNFKILLIILINLFIIETFVIAQKYKEYESKGETVNGFKEGRWINVTNDGVIYKEYFYKNGKPIGNWKNFCPDGKIRNESVILNNRVVNFKIFKPNMASIEIMYDSGFSDKQYLKLVDFEDYFYTDQLYKKSLEDNGIKLVPRFKDEWKDKLNSTVYSLNIKVKVRFNYVDGSVQSELTAEKDKGISQIDFYYDKQNRIKKKDFFENGKLTKSMTYKNGVFIKEEIINN